MATEKVKITVNGKEIEVEKNTYLLKVLKENGISVPTLCNHKDLTPSGTCRLCVVEIGQGDNKKLVTSCNYPVRSEINVETDSEKVKKHRKTLAEIYLGRWPNVPVIKKIARECEATDSEKYKSELTDENPKACVLCGRCKRACAEFIQENIIDFAGRGIKDRKSVV